VRLDFLFRDCLIGLAFVCLDFEYGCELVWTSNKCGLDFMSVLFASSFK
jgi:hypothetical protein